MVDLISKIMKLWVWEIDMISIETISWTISFVLVFFLFYSVINTIGNIHNIVKCLNHCPRLKYDLITVKIWPRIPWPWTGSVNFFWRFSGGLTSSGDLIEEKSESEDFRNFRNSPWKSKDSLIDCSSSTSWPSHGSFGSLSMIT